MTKSYFLFVYFIACCFQLLAQNNHQLTKKWTPLFDMNSSYWENYVGVPHSSVELEGYPKSNNVTKDTPLGLNNDVKKVMTFTEHKSNVIMNITGEMYSGLTSLSEYSNYHFKVDFKWGDKKWEPRLDKKRDSGILYHCRGEHGAFSNVWMESLELQVQEGDIGDFVALLKVNGRIPARNEGDEYYYLPEGESPLLFGAKANGPRNPGYCHIWKSAERPHGEWNTIELFCLGNNAIHVVNGVVVLVVRNSKQIVNGEEIILDSGKIQIQSEGAECYYRNAKIKSINKFPAKYKKIAGL